MGYVLTTWHLVNPLALAHPPSMFPFCFGNGSHYDAKGGKNVGLTKQPSMKNIGFMVATWIYPGGHPITSSISYFVLLSLLSSIYTLAPDGLFPTLSA